jgi:hypothetical protein
MTVTVQIKNIYGMRTVYPACDVSKRFAQLAGTKTLTPKALNTIRDMGYTIAVKPETI